MVKDTRKTLCPGAFKPVDLPEAILVRESKSGTPLSVRDCIWQTVAGVEGCWRIDDEWWRPQVVSRLYFELRLASGCKICLFKNLADGCWFRQNY
ncbi:hypothetical protein UCH007_13080 [Dehalococcoides sp. UCH007]|jgi:hypothetical protein|nr:hypothetical protein UCH007_13080 [Dehalococcoides sp. UCH007]